MKISIITATYNSAATVSDTLESLLRQSYKNYELIIKDGGSKDDTLEICRSYEPAFDGRMKIISCPDKGLYDAMNQGIKAATGDVVGILNSDDFYTSFDVLMAIARQFERTPEIDAVYGDIHYVDWDDTTRLKRYYSSRLFRPGWMRLGFMPAHPSFYCRKSVYENFRLNVSSIDGWKGETDCAYFNTTYKIAADFECLLRMLYCGKIKTAYIWKDFVTMRHGGASSSGSAAHKQINREHLRALKENGIYSNIAILSLRYIYKIGELALGRIRRTASVFA
ncbi:MAG: glycosyltransferase [Bacteroidaceae bacterium]|nr:glycosyltransferase [Bacteroidaceae bacterium]